jgi:tetratricopeptide (TPR) repeat protein
MYFYSTMEEYGKAIDYAMRVYAVDRQLWDGYGMVTDLNRVAGFFSSNNQRDLALRMCEHSIALADSLHYNLFKINSYFRIFNMYFQGNEYVKAYRYLTAQPGMSDYLIHVGYSFYPLEIKAAALAEEGLYDSAFYYYQLAAPLVLERGNTEVKTDFFVLFGNYYIRRLRYREAIDCYQKAYALLAAEKDLSDEVTVTDTLQRLYERTGDYRQALVYNRLAGAERDSLRAQTQETELMKLEVETENRRRERAAREEELNTEHRHNIQYMGFTAGLVLLFIAIVLLGRLKVPVSVIRTVVFLSFIFLFEFIILLLDRTIQAWTHEEPWKVLLIKILLASGLVPLHHWLEHRVIHYLSHRRRPATALAQKTH